MAPTTPPTPICSDCRSGSPSSGITLVPRSSTSSLIDQTSMILLVVFLGLFLIAFFAVSVCLSSYRVQTGINPLPSSLSERSTMRGETHEFAETETSALLQRGRLQRDTIPRTAHTIDGEMHYLRQVLERYRSMPQTQETGQRMFDVLRSLVENALDLLMVSHLPQSHVENVRFWCKQLVGISERLERPWTRIVAQFYEGHFLIAQARLLERNESNQTTASEVMKLFAKAFKNFYDAKKISRTFHMTPDREIQVYLSSSILSCAFIVSKFPQLARLEGDLTTDPEYTSFKDVLRPQPNKDLLEKKMLELDYQLHS